MEKEAELIEKIKNENDDLSFKTLLDDYVKMIQSIINNFHLECGNYRVSNDDLMQEGIIGLLEACKSYKECYCTKFSTYAYTLIKRRVQKFYYDAMDRYNEEKFSLDNLKIYDHCSFIVYDNKTNFEDIKYNREKLEKSMSILREQDKEIVRMRIDNYSYEEIAKMLNVSKKRIDNRLYRIRQKYTLNDVKRKKDIHEKNVKA